MIYQKLGVSTSYVGTFIRWAVGMENNESNIQLNHKKWLWHKNDVCLDDIADFISWYMFMVT